MKKLLRNKKGFTLIEIIAVLVILGILAAVAIPKYMSLMDEARKKAGQQAIAEVKSRLAQGYATTLLQKNGDPTQVTNALILTAAGPITSGTAFDTGDYNVTVTMGASDTAATIAVNTVQTVAVTGVTGTWTKP